MFITKRVETRDKKPNVIVIYVHMHISCGLYIINEHGHKQWDKWLMDLG